MRVLNKATDALPEDAVYVGRPTKWGNPYTIGKDGTRKEVIEKYRRYLRNSPHLLESLDELSGKNLVCWCSPLPCHADILIQEISIMEREQFIRR